MEMANAVLIMRSTPTSLVSPRGQRQLSLPTGARFRADCKSSCCTRRASLVGAELAGLFSIDKCKSLLSDNPVSLKQSSAQRKAFNVVSAATKVKSPAETDWKTKRDFLLRARVRSVSPKDALKLQQEQGYTIVDVRPEGEYKEGHPAGALNAQVYRLIKDWTLWDISRRVAFAFFGILQGTEENPGFLDEIKSKLGKDDKIIVACIAGGTIKPTPNLAEGSQSRSLIAAYLLALEGYKNIAHIEGGLREWFKQDLPIEDDTDP